MAIKKLEIDISKGKFVSREPDGVDLSGNAHTRTAVAIANVISDAPIGMSLGLEGGWGTGKSNLVSMIKQSKKSDTRFIIFDAWEHEGDGLRRSFLDHIATELDAPKAIRAEIWKTGEQVTKTVSKKTTFLSIAFIVAISLSTFSTGFVSYYSDIEKDIPTWLDTPLFTFILLPILLLITLLVWPVIWHIFSKLPLFASKLSFSEKMDRTWRIVQSKESPVTEEYEERTVSNSFAEFEHLLSEVIGNKNLKTVVVIDNLDRLEGNTARAFWSSIAPFLSRTMDNKKDFKNLFLIVPFSHKHLMNIFIDDKPSGENLSNEDKEKLLTGIIDKNFDAVFSVPPLTVAKWPELLENKLIEAFDGLAHRSNLIENIQSIVKRYYSDDLTPRTIIAFVNSMVAVGKTSINSSIPLEAIAMFVAIKPKTTSDSRKPWDATIDQAAIRLTGIDRLKEHLLSLHFGMGSKEALSAAISQFTPKCIEDGNANSLEYFFGMPEFSKLLKGEIQNIHDNNTLNDAESFEQFLNFIKDLETRAEEHSEIEAKTVNNRSMLCKIFHEVSDWHKHPALFAECAIKSCVNLSDTQTKAFWKSYADKLSHFRNDDKEQTITAESWLNAYESIPEESGLTQVVTPPDSNLTFNILTALNANKIKIIPNKKANATPLLEMSADVNQPTFLRLISWAIALKKNNGKFIDDLATTQITQQIIGNINQGNVETFKQRLKIVLLKYLFSTSEDNEITALWSDGSLPSHFTNYTNDNELKALFYLMFLTGSAPFSQPTNQWQAHNGFNQLNAAIQGVTPEAEDITILKNYLLKMGVFQNIIKYSYGFTQLRPLITALLKTSVNKATKFIFNPEYLFDDPDWCIQISHSLSEEPDGGIDTLIQRIVDAKAIYTRAIDQDLNLGHLQQYIWLVGLGNQGQAIELAQKLGKDIGLLESDQWHQLLRDVNSGLLFAELMPNLRIGKKAFKCNFKAGDAVIKHIEETISSRTQAPPISSELVNAIFKNSTASDKATYEKKIVREIFQVSAELDSISSLLAQFDLTSFNYNSLVKFKGLILEILDLAITKNHKASANAVFEILSVHSKIWDGRNKYAKAINERFESCDTDTSLTPDIKQLLVEKMPLLIGK